MINQVAPPPQNTDAERALLGACLVERAAVKAAVRITKPAEFYSTAHQEIFSAIESIHLADHPVDLLTLTAELRDRKKLDDVGGVAYLMGLGEMLPTAANAEQYARIVRDKHLLRGAMRSSYETLNKILSGASVEEVTKAINDTSFGLNAEAMRSSGSDLYHVREALAEIHSEIMNAGEKGLAHKICLKTGNPQLDQYALFQPSYLIYLAGRPSSGKTTFAFHLALKFAAQGVPVYFGSYEVARRFCMVRLLCQAGNIQNKKIMFRDPQEIREALGIAMNRLHNYPLYLSHRSLSVEGIAQVVEQIRDREKRAPVVFIDRFELIDEPYVNQDSGEYSRLSRIALKLRRLKDEYEIPVCCLIQMNRKIEDRKEKVPALADLQGTGATEQCAQVVAFVHRDKELNKSQAKSGLPQTAFLYVEKNMNGSTGHIPYQFASEIPNFFELADHEERTEPKPAPPARHWQDAKEEAYDECPF